MGAARRCGQAKRIRRTRKVLRIRKLLDENGMGEIGNLK